MASTIAPKAEYQLKTTDAAESQLAMLQRLQLSPEAHRELQSYSHKQGVLFISTPFDNESVDLLDELGVPAFKIGSGDITNQPLLEYVARKGKPIILSTGMCYLSEVEEAVSVIRSAGNDQLILLHCVSNYPANPADVNLRVMDTMAAAFHVPVGYSDHTLGIEVALAAVAMGGLKFRAVLRYTRLPYASALWAWGPPRDTMRSETWATGSATFEVANFHHGGDGQGQCRGGQR